MIIRDALRSGEACLDEAAVESARVDAELLLSSALGVSRVDLHTSSGREVRSDELRRYGVLLERRAHREPLAYVLGEWGFRRLTLVVDARVLVPRPETEVVVERCLAQIAEIAEPRVLDVGTGSGAIALAIADEHPGALVTGIDASPDALAVARENASRTGLDLELARWDLFHGLPEGAWDLVVSNPPYVRTDEIEGLAPEVRDWEPRAALVGEGTTEAVVAGAAAVLRPGGAVVLETAAADARRIAGLLEGGGYRDVRITSDIAGRDRVVEGTIGT